MTGSIARIARPTNPFPYVKLADCMTVEKNNSAVHRYVPYHSFCSLLFIYRYYENERLT